MFSDAGISARAIIALVLPVLMATPVAAQPVPDLLTRDVPGAADHPLVRRYQGAVLLAQTAKAYDELVLPAGPAEGRSFAANQKFAAIVTAQGKATRAIYVAPPGRSSMEVTMNFTDAVVGKGFETVFTCAGTTCGESFSVLKYRWNRPETKVQGENYDRARKLMVDAVFDQLIETRYSLFRKSSAEGDTYVAVYGGLHRGGGFGDNSVALQDRVGVLVEVVEPRQMDRSMMVVSAAEIGDRVAAEGRAVFYGVQFESDRADIKPDSERQLAEMAKYLQSNPQTRVYIIAHTDNKDGVDDNAGLSYRRADAVVRTLASKYRIDARRLTPRGPGRLAPIASHRTGDGPTKNRWVEMVKQ